LGPYFVIAPGIALAHAAPSRACLETGFALLRLDQPVFSGSSNDPVRLLFAFCAVDSSSHIELLGEFSRTMSEPEKVNLLLNASDVTQIRNLFGTGLVK
jgi:PTS system ascorbate-specific IIA component